MDLLQTAVDIRIQTMNHDRRVEFPGGSEYAELSRSRGEAEEALKALLSPEALSRYLALDSIETEMIAHEYTCYYRAGFADGVELHRALDVVSKASKQPEITVQDG